MMINAHDLASHSRTAHTGRLTEANEYRLAKIATSRHTAAPVSFSYRSRIAHILDFVTSRLRIARSGV